MEREALRQRVAELEEIVCGNAVAYQGLGLTAREAKLLGAMVRREAVTYEDIVVIVTDDVMDDGGGVSREVVRKIVHRLRTRLSRLDPPVRLLSVWGAGYRLDAEAKDTLRRMLR